LENPSSWFDRRIPAIEAFGDLRNCCKDAGGRGFPSFTLLIFRPVDCPVIFNCSVKWFTCSKFVTITVHKF